MAAIPINFAQVFNFDEVFEDDSIRFENKGGGPNQDTSTFIPRFEKEFYKVSTVTSFKLSYTPYKWSYKWVDGGYKPILIGAP